jgi:hypothetical protein
MLSDAMEKLKRSLVCVSHNGAQHSHIIIEESDENASLRKVTLIAPNGDWFSFEPDKGTQCKRIHSKAKLVLMSPLLAIGQHDHHRACDCVVLVNRSGKLTALYVELKSGNPSGYAGQFKSTRQFVRYALGLLEEFHNAKLVLSEERYLVLYSSAPLLGKTTTVPKLQKLGNSEPSKPFKRAGDSQKPLYLKEFLT